MRPHLLALSLAVFGLLPRLGAQSIVISDIDREHGVGWAKVDGGWVNKSWVPGLTTLRVKLRLDSGAARGGFFARAYFFDKNKALILEYKSPPQVEVELGRKYATLPPHWKDAENYEIYFPIPPEKDKGPGDWKTAIVVFGNADMVVADAYPGNANLQDFSFPEKDRLAALPSAP